MDVVGVRHVKGYVLEVAFENGERAELDLSGYASLGGVFEPLADINFFKKVSVNADVGTLCWPNGADIAPETLYRLTLHQDRASIVAESQRGAKIKGRRRRT